MKDALVLAEHIIQALQQKLDLNTAVQGYEQEMFIRATKVQQESLFNKTRMFRADAPIGFMVDMMDVIFGAKGKSLDTGLLAWLPIKRSVYIFLWLKTTWGEFAGRLRPMLFGW